MKIKFLLLFAVLLTVSCGEGGKNNPLLDQLFIEITADRDSLYFGDDTEENSMSFNIVNSSLRTLEWQLRYSSPWITEVGIKDGLLESNKSESITVEIDRGKLTPGYNFTFLEILTTDLDKSSDIKISALGYIEPPEETLPLLNTLEPLDISSDKVVLQGEIIDPGYPEYTERGFVISETECPFIGDIGVTSYKALVNDEERFSQSVSIKPHTTYYVRAYAVNKLGTAYGNDVSFTSADRITEVATIAVSGITSTSAILNGRIAEEGEPKYTERGFCYSGNNNPMPTIMDSRLQVSGSGEGDFSYNIEGLETGKDYYVRAYAIQNGRPVYGDAVRFTTVFNSVSVSTSNVSNIGAMSATFNGIIMEEGEPPYTEKGFCYSKAPDSTPEITDDAVIVDGTGTGSYSYEVDGLELNTTYYVRAYAIQNGRPVYGDAVRFTTAFNSVSVSTSNVSNIGAMSATFNGIIMEEGEPPYTEKGFCYSKAPDSTPEITDDAVIVDGTGTGSYSYEVDGLELNTTYYVRAYAIQNENIVYGETKQFTTVFEEVSVSTSDVSGISFYSATFNGNILNEGKPPYTEKGFCYGMSSDVPPDISDNAVTVNGGGTGFFTHDIDGLTPGTTYYVRAYAVQNGKTSYGEMVSFITSSSRTEISTLEPSEIDVDYARVNAYIASVGHPSYTERGFCYSAYPDVSPDINDNRTPVAGAAVAGEYSSLLSGLERQTTYYVRAYAVQDGEVIYGNTVNFTTVWEYASVTNYGSSNQSLGTVQLNAGVVNQGYPKYTEKGFVYITVDAMEWYEAGGPELEPTLLDNRTPVVSGTDGTGNYSLRLTGVNGNIVCGFRPYLIQGGEPVYGEPDYFLSYSLPEVTTYSIVGDSGDPSRAQLNGVIEWQGNPAYIESGFAVSIEDPLPEINAPGVATVKAQASEGTLFASVVTGIPEGRTIYVRAYVRNSNGTAYGKVLTYTNIGL